MVERSDDAALDRPCHFRSCSFYVQPLSHGRQARPLNELWKIDALHTFYTLHTFTPFFSYPYRSMNRPHRRVISACISGVIWNRFFL